MIKCGFSFSVVVVVVIIRREAKKKTKSNYDLFARTLYITKDRSNVQIHKKKFSFHFGESCFLFVHTENLPKRIYSVILTQFCLFWSKIVRTWWKVKVFSQYFFFFIPMHKIYHNQYDCIENLSEWISISCYTQFVIFVVFRNDSNENDE